MAGPRQRPIPGRNFLRCDGDVRDQRRAVLAAALQRCARAPEIAAAARVTGHRIPRNRGQRCSRLGGGRLPRVLPPDRFRQPGGAPDRRQIRDFAIRGRRDRGAEGESAVPRCGRSRQPGAAVARAATRRVVKLGRKFFDSAVQSRSSNNEGCRGYHRWPLKCSEFSASASPCLVFGVRESDLFAVENGTVRIVVRCALRRVTAFLQNLEMSEKFG